MASAPQLAVPACHCAHAILQGRARPASLIEIVGKRHPAGCACGRRRRALWQTPDTRHERRHRLGWFSRQRRHRPDARRRRCSSGGAPAGAAGSFRRAACAAASRSSRRCSANCTRRSASPQSTWSSSGRPSAGCATACRRATCGATSSRCASGRSSAGSCCACKRRGAASTSTAPASRNSTSGAGRPTGSRCAKSSTSSARCTCSALTELAALAFPRGKQPPLPEWWAEYADRRGRGAAAAD